MVVLTFLDNPFSNISSGATDKHRIIYFNHFGG